MIWFLINAIVILTCIWVATRKYGTLLNPVAFFGGFYLMAAVIGPMLFDNLGLFDDVTEKSVRYASGLSSLYFAAIGIAFAIRSSPFKAAFRWLFTVIPPLRRPVVGSRLAELWMIGQFFVLFVLLMLASGVGLLWVTDTREAYARHRASVGVLWSLSEAILFLAFMGVIFRRVRSLTSLFINALLFAAISSFLGAKGVIAAFFVVALFYGHFLIRPISNKTVLFTGSGVLTLTLGAQLYQGTATSLLGTLLYFDYFTNTVALIDRFKDFGFRYGMVTLSNLWYFVPRALYPAKPFVYSLVIADEFLYPGAAERGYTPGMMQWAQGYCDFGIIGVILFGLFIGFLSKGAYELFLERKDIQSMALFFQIGTIYGIEMFSNAPLIVFFIWLLFQLVVIQFLSRLWPFRVSRFVWLSSRPISLRSERRLSQGANPNDA